MCEWLAHCECCHPWKERPGMYRKAIWTSQKEQDSSILYMTSAPVSSRFVFVSLFCFVVFHVPVFFFDFPWWGCKLKTNHLLRSWFSHGVYHSNRNLEEAKLWLVEFMLSVLGKNVEINVRKKWNIIMHNYISLTQLWLLQNKIIICVIIFKFAWLTPFCLELWGGGIWWW